jgi:hypothetical protein
MHTRSSGGSIKHCHVGRYRPFLSQISPGHGTQGISASPQQRKPTKISLPTRNPHTAQLGSHQSYRHEAFIRLARSLQRTKVIPWQSVLLSQSPKSIAVRGCDGETAKESNQTEFISLSYLDQCYATEKPDHRRNSRGISNPEQQNEVWASSRSCRRHVFSCGEADAGGVEVGVGERGLDGA